MQTDSFFHDLRTYQDLRMHPVIKPAAWLCPQIITYN